MVEFVGSRVQGVGVRVHGLGFRVWGVFLQKGEGNVPNGRPGEQLSCSQTSSGPVFRA